MGELATFLQIDGPALLAAILTAIPCALTGSFLLLRRQAMMADALSHVVLPGIVGGFIIGGGITLAAMAGGALVACIAAVFLMAALERVSRVDEGTAMGIVFTAMFALGIVMLENGAGTRVHLDVQHALFGALELITWTKPSMGGMPPQLISLALVTLFSAAVIAALYKELAAASFDAVHAQVAGLRPRLLSFILLLTAALTAVAAFQAVGSILVIALFICPPAAARMLTDHLGRQLALSVVLGIGACILGYGLAVLVPAALGFPQALNAAGMIALAAGALQILAMLLAPRYGALNRRKAAFQ